MEEPTPIKILTKITLKKFDGDPPREGEDKEPVETIVLEDEADWPPVDAKPEGA